MREPRAAAVAVSVMFAVGCSSGTPLATNAPVASIDASAAPTPRATAMAAPSASPPNVDDAAWVVQRNAEIHVLDGEGNDLISVSTDADGRNPTNPDWSPDGQRLTFVMTDDSGRDDLWVVNVDGSDARRVYDCADSCANLDDPAWSPDGQSIAACKNSHDVNHPADLVAVDVETGQETSLLTPGLDQFCAGPRWSPDGTQIVLEMVTTDGAPVDAEVTGVVLSIVDLAKQSPAARGLTKANQFAATADWGPASDLIVFNRRLDDGGENNDIYTINPDGTGLTRVTYLADDDGSAYEPSWDNEGKTVVFVNDNGALMRVDVASGEVEPAFETTVFANHPRVRPRP